MTAVDRTTPGRRDRGVRHDPAFRRLWAALSISQFGSSVAGIATPLLAVQVLHASVFTVSLLTAAAWLPWLLIGLPAGVVVDRLPRRPVMLACDVVSALLVLSLPVAAWLWHLTVAHLLAVALLGGAAAVFFHTAHTAYLPAMFSAERLVSANATVHGSESAVQVAGPALGGALIAAVGGVAALLVDAASFAVSALLLLLIRRPERRPAASEAPAQRPGLRREIAAGVRWLARDRYLRTLTLHGAACNLVLTGYNALVVVFLIREVGVGVGTVGALMAVSSLGGVAAATVTGRVVRRVGGARALVLLKAGSGVASLLIPFTGAGAGLIWFALGTALVGALVTGGNVVTGAFRQAYVPPELLGRVLTSMQFVNYGLIPVGAVLGGLAATAFGTRTAIAVLTAGYALTGLILLLGPWRHLRDLPAPPGTGSGEARQAGTG